MEDSDDPNGLIYPELSYKIVGCLFEVWNELGPGHLEKTYQRALAMVFRDKTINFKEQVSAPVYFKEKLISKRYLDFVIDEKIVLELKKDQRFSIAHIKQVHDYLILTKLKLAILANFSANEVYTKRVLNIR